jgi:hypothetical protein
MVKAKRGLKVAKSKDVGDELYTDFTKFLSKYLNMLDNDELVQYRVMNRDKAEELILNMSSVHEEVQAILDKLHLDAAKFVSRYWNKMDMKVSIQDTVIMLLKGKMESEE